MEQLSAEGEKVLILTTESDTQERIAQATSAIKANWQIQRLEALIDAKIQSSSFDHVFFGYLSQQKKLDSQALLLEVLRLLKPSGKLHFRKSGKDDCVMKDFVLNLKFSGFVNIQETSDSLQAAKPNYEIGTGISIATHKPVQSSTSQTTTATTTVASLDAAKKLWEGLSTSDLNTGELIDTDELLTDEDLKKPDPESLRVCGTTGKRKACANCSCGLAEELDKATIEARQDTQNAKSSCGSCYLGDAFRCASCPYLGMPAFKPGEKVVLDNLSDL